MASALPVLALALTALLCVVIVPRLLPRWHWLRRTPGPALALWQVVSVAGVLGALMTAPAASIALATDGGTVPTFFSGTTRVSIAVVVATMMTGGMTLLLLRSGHRIGSDLRADRRSQRDLVDLVASRRDGSLRVVDHPGRSAYCVPGLRSRVVLTQETITALSEDELQAVLAHEGAHAMARHDLMLEFFTVLHRAAPQSLRSADALQEVQLLIELLADRRAVRQVGADPLGRALVAMTGSSHPTAALGSSGTASELVIRVRALPHHERRAHPLIVPVLMAIAVVGATPWVLLAWAFWA